MHSTAHRVKPTDLRSGFVLIVSADADVCDLYVQVFRFNRIAAIGVNHVDDAAALGRNAPIAAILFDVLTAHDWTACQAIAATDGLAAVPVVVLTAWVAADGRFRRRAEEIGCAAFISKPCAPDLIVSTVERVRRGERGIEIITIP
jgi:two-component system cell cycle response regulator DivK